MAPCFFRQKIDLQTGRCLQFFPECVTTIENYCPNRQNISMKGCEIVEIKRDSYLQELISYQWDGQIKVITGTRRCGKAYLLKIYIRIT